MGTTAQQADPMAAIAALRTQGASDNDIEAYLTQIGAKQVSGPVGGQIHAAAQRPGGMVKLRAATADRNLADTADIPTIGEDIAQTLETPLAGVPGGALAMSAAQKFAGDRRPFGDIQRAVNTQTSDTRASGLGRGIGAVAATGLLGNLSGAAGGAIYGGADEALNNDPGSGLLNRAVRAMGGAAGGALAGGAADRLVAGARAALPKVLGGAGNAASTRASMLADQAASAKKLYGAALTEGAGKPFTPELKAFLASDDIAPIVANLKQERAMAGIADESPEMLDAVYKNLSDQASTLKGKLAALTPRGANTGRVAAKSVGMAKGALLDAAEPVMPSYAAAVQDFAKRAKDIETFDAGYDALSKAAGGGKTTAKNLNRLGKSKDVGTFTDWMGTLTGPEARIAAQGTIGSLRDEPLGLSRTPKALGKAAAMLRATDRASGNLPPSLLRKALMAFGESYASPLGGFVTGIIEP